MREPDGEIIRPTAADYARLKSSVSGCSGLSIRCGSGLSPGDQVATSGVFLIAAEARISTAAKYWEPIADAQTPPSMPMPMPTPAPAPAPAHTPAPTPTTSPTTATSPAPTTATPPSPPSVTYTCPMHPEVHSASPGKCPKCGMDLVPETRHP